MNEDAQNWRTQDGQEALVKEFCADPELADYVLTAPNGMGALICEVMSRILFLESCRRKK